MLFFSLSEEFRLAVRPTHSAGTGSSPREINLSYFHLFHKSE